MQITETAQRRLLLAVFVLSGFTGLIYESIWSHYLKLFLGHAAYAQTLVLAIFMGGLALGSWLVARVAVRLRNLLFGYVIVEASIGVLAIVFNREFVASTNFSYDSIIPAIPPGLLLDAFKWLLGSLLILPQSVLLGMTFPLLSGALVRRWPQLSGQSLATLYFTNSLGAAVGVLVSGFVLIGAVGLPGTILTAGVLNVALALLVWLIVKGQAQPAAAVEAARPQGSDRLARWFRIAALLTGAAAFMYELGWIRMLSLVLGSSTHSFELMLSAFILGLALGGLFVRKRIAVIANPEGYIGAVMIVMGACAALTLPAYNLTFDFMASSLATFTRTPGGYVAFNLISQSIAALVMIPTTFCAGMTLPLLTHALMRRGSGERAIGTIYALNTVGAIVGVLVTVHILMPLIGLKGVVLAGAALHIGLGVSSPGSMARLRRGAVAAVWLAGAAIYALVVFAVHLDPLRLASGVYRTGVASLSTDAHVIYLRDGKTATISVAEQNGMVAIATNGKPDAALRMGAGPPSADEPTMILAAALPLSMHSHPDRVANVGFGSGLTAHTLLTSGKVGRLDSIEIEPRMVEAARAGFGPRISNVFTDPRSHIIYEDAKTYFAATREPYDLIVSEPSNPWVSGVASLFSDEFYARVVQHLAPDGYLVQWLQIYETDATVLASVTKALAAHFGSYAMYDLNDSDILIIASRGDHIAAPSDAIFQWPQLRAELNRVGVTSIADMQRRIIGNRRTIGPLIDSLPVPRNSDYFPYVDLNAARLRYERGSAIEFAELTILPIPFVEVLVGDFPQAAAVAPSARSILWRDGQVRQALAIRHAVMSGGLADLDLTAASSLLLIDTDANRCADPAAQVAWQHSIRFISDSTAAFLAPADLAGIWDRILASPCYRSVAGEHRTWAELFAAIARRDAAHVVSSGMQLLDSGSPKTNDQRAFLTTAIATSQVQLRQFQEARILMQSQWNRFHHEEPFAFPLKVLLAYAASAAAERR